MDRTIISRSRSLVLSGFVFLAGCATQGGGGAAGGGRASIDPDREKTPSGFPTPKLLEKIRAEPVRIVVSTDAKKDVDTWQLEGPVLSDGATLGHPVNKPWERLLTERVQAKGPSAIADESMSCIAREVGNFYLAHKAYPASALQSFIVGRCAAPNASTRVFAFSVNADAKMKEDKLVELMRDWLIKQINETPNVPTAFGLWFGQKNKQSVFMLAIGERKLHLKEVVASDKDKKVTTVRGQLLVNAAKLRAVITRGAYGSAACEQTGLQLPAFEVRCTGDQADDAAWIELSSVANESDLSEPLASLVVSPSGKPSDTYKRADYFAGAKPANIDDLTRLLHNAINTARTGAGLNAVELDAKESTAATQLAQHYFASVTGVKSATIADTIALGLRAGWNVDGNVKDGTFMSIGPTSIENSEGMLASAFERPSSRLVLFGKDVKKIAIGAYWSTEEKRTGAMVTAYSMLEPIAPEQMQTMVLEKLNAARAKAGKSPVKVPRELDRVVDRVVEGVGAGRITADEALEKILKDVNEELKVPVRGSMLPFRDLESIEFPAELTSTAELDVGLEGLVQKSELEPWAGYAVWIAFPTGAKK